jgi:hypothetical protein
MTNDKERREEKMHRPGDQIVFVRQFEGNQVGEFGTIVTATAEHLGKQLFERLEVKTDRGVFKFAQTNTTRFIQKREGDDND